MKGLEKFSAQPRREFTFFQFILFILYFIYLFILFTMKQTWEIICQVYWTEPYMQQYVNLVVLYNFLDGQVENFSAPS